MKTIQEIIQEIAELIKEGKVLFFVGSGISREKPTYLPTGDTLKNELAESFCFDQTNEIKNRLLKAIKNITLEEVSQVFDEHVGAQLLDVLSGIFDDVKIQPNRIHQYLAKSLTYGNVVITTNYDSIIERAYIESVLKRDEKRERLGLYYDDTHFDEINDLAIEDLKKSSNIFKLHGTFQDIRNKKRNTRDSVITILTRVESLSIPKIKVLRKLFGIYHAVFMGYSARDLDIFDALLEIFEDKAVSEEALNSCRQGREEFLRTRIDKKIFWVKYSPPEQEPKILTCDEIKDESNPDKLILIKCRYGRDLGVNLGVKIKQAAINFVEELAID